MVQFYTRIIVFLAGVFIGILLGTKCINIPKHKTTTTSSKHFPQYNSWFKSQGFKRSALSWDILRYGQNKYSVESELLLKYIKVQCVILQRKPENVKAARNTWATGCTDLKTAEIITRGRNLIALKRAKENSSWVLLCEILKSISTNYDWYLIVNDNTFVILENLRYYVAALNSLDTYYLGYPVKFWNTIYNWGQAGYLLSKGTVKVLQEVLNKDGCSMNAYWNREDFYLGKQLARLNITPVDTRDADGLSTFHPYNWYQVFFPQVSFYKTSVYPTKCCSKYSVTFQAIEGDKMYTYYYLLYKLQIFKHGNLGNTIFSQKMLDDQVWKMFLKERNINYNVTSEEYYKIWENLVDDPASFAAHMKRESDFNYE